MSGEKEWQGYGITLKELLNLEYSPVAINYIQGTLLKNTNKKIRICQAILEAGKGSVCQIDKENNACFGASWHLGFLGTKERRIEGMIRKFVIEREKLFVSHQALEKLLAQVEELPRGPDAYFTLAPLEKCALIPQLAIFICNPEAACRLLTLATFSDGLMPKIKIGGPTCRMSVIYPLLSQEINLSFYDYTARKMCNLEKDKLIITIPYRKLPQIIESIGRCPAGKAKMEFVQQPPVFVNRDSAGV